MKALPLVPEPLTAEAFAPFGDVIQTEGKDPDLINYGHTRKWANLMSVDTADSGGRTAVHLFEGGAATLPLRIEVVERHPLGSQAFIPLHSQPFLVVVAQAGSPPKPAAVRAFLTNGRQGVNYHKGTWHHYLVSPEEGARYLVIDRAGPGVNFEEHTLDAVLVVESARGGIGVSQEIIS